MGGDVEDLTAGAASSAFAVAVAAPVPLGGDFDLQAEPTKADRASIIMQVNLPANESRALRSERGEQFIFSMEEQVISGPTYHRGEG